MPPLVQLELPGEDRIKPTREARDMIRESVLAFVLLAAIPLAAIDDDVGVAEAPDQPPKITVMVHKVYASPGEIPESILEKNPHEVVAIFEPTPDDRHTVARYTVIPGDRPEWVRRLGRLSLPFSRQVTLNCHSAGVPGRETVDRPLLLDARVASTTGSDGPGGPAGPSRMGGKTGQRLLGDQTSNQ